MHVVLWFLVVVIQGVFAEVQSQNGVGGRGRNGVVHKNFQDYSPTRKNFVETNAQPEEGIHAYSATIKDDLAREKQEKHASSTTWETSTVDIKINKVAEKNQNDLNKALNKKTDNNTEATEEDFDQFSTLANPDRGISLPLVNPRLSTVTNEVKDDTIEDPFGPDIFSWNSAENDVNEETQPKEPTTVSSVDQFGLSSTISSYEITESSLETSTAEMLSTSTTFPKDEDAIYVDCFPLPIVNFSEVTPSSFGVTLKWNNVAPSGCLYEYRISLNDKTYSTSELQYTVTGLYACSSYTASIGVYYQSTPGTKSSTSFDTPTPDPFNATVINLTLTKTPEDKVGVSWEPPPDEVFSCVTNYSIIWWDENHHDIETQQEILDITTTHYELPLIGCAAYGVEVYPMVGANNGNNALGNFTVGPTPTSPPTVDAFSHDKRNATVTWGTDDKTQNRCALEEIIVTCEALPDANSDFGWVVAEASAIEPVDVNSADSRYTMSVNDLSPFTNYTCYGLVVNEGGNSSTTPVEFQTDEDVPSEPTSLKATDIGPNNFTLAWSEPEMVPGIMTEYQLVINNNGPLHFPGKECQSNTTNHNFTINATNTSFQFEDGLPYYKYTIILYGVDGAGDGEPATIDVTTQSTKPDPVANAQRQPPVYSDSDTYSGTVTVTFEPPCNTNGPLKYYEVIYVGIRDGFDDDQGSISTNATTAEISLLPDRDYQISVSVVTENFTSDGASVEPLHSKPGVPGPVAEMPPPSSGDTTTAHFTLNKSAFDTSNGQILAFALILCSNSQCQGNSYGFWDGSEANWPEIPAKAVQLTPNLWNPFKGLDGLDTWDFTIGANGNCSNTNYCNQPLKENTEYSLIVRALTSAAYRDSSQLKFKTKMLDGGLNLALILGLTFGLLALVLLVVFIIILWRRKRKSVLVEEEKRYSTSTPAPVPVQKFTNHYVGIKENYTIIKQQFSDLGVKSKDVAGEVTFALLPENRRKNRYTNILPYDTTRVTLKIDEDDEISSDYINASYIKGYSGKIEYIATQGPLETTTRDFWKMILQENVSIIVMVSQFVEQTKEKCYQYFPNNHESVYFGESLEVKCCTELHFGTYCIRTLQVRRGSEQRDVIHMQFLEWPDFGVPQGTDNMLQFCQALREKVSKEGGLVVVHCSAGVGRTGTLIALDILLQAIDDHRDINIYKTVLDLRRQRTNMVQTEKQFMFIHTCIKDHLETPTIPTSDTKEERIYENMDVLKSSLKKNLIESELESAL